MNWKKSTRFIFRSTLVVLAVAALLGMAAFLPGSVEGNYNNFWVSSCGCDSRTIMHLRADKWVTYRTGHDDEAELEGRYVTRTDGVVEIYGYPLDEGKKERLVMKAYSRILITKFVAEESGEAYWRWKLPSIGVIGEAIRKHKVHMTVWPPKGRLRRTVYGPDLKLRRHEANVGSGKWKTVTGDEIPLTVYHAIRHVHEDPFNQPKRLPLLGSDTTEAAGSGQNVILRSYHVGKELATAYVSPSRFGPLLEQAMIHDSSVDSLYRRHLDLIAVFGDRCFLIEYENGEANGESPEGDRLRITRMTVTGIFDDPLLQSGAHPIGTSYDEEILRLLRKATASYRESRE